MAKRKHIIKTFYLFIYFWRKKGVNTTGKELRGGGGVMTGIKNRPGVNTEVRGAVKS